MYQNIFLHCQKVTSSLIDLIFFNGCIDFGDADYKNTIFTIFLLFPLVVIPLLYFISIGMGFFLSAANVFFRDIQYIYNAITVAWMYVTPMFYQLIFFRTG